MEKEIKLSPATGNAVPADEKKITHTHIALVGGQPHPVYGAIKALQPDRVAYIYSKDSQKQLATLRKEINLPEIPQEQLDPTDPVKIQQRVNALVQQLKDDRVTINISSGSKPWSLFFSKGFDSHPNAEILFVSQNNKLYNYTTLEQAEVTYNMEVLFRLKGNPLEHYRPYTDYTAKDKAAMRHILDAWEFAPNKLRSLASVLEKSEEARVKNDNKGIIKHPDGSTIDWNKSTNMVNIHLQKSGFKAKDFRLDSPHAVELAFNTHWFELYVADMLSRWSGADEIRMNCLFPQHGQNDNPQKNTKNEIDIVMYSNQKLLFVECKTGIHQITDIDKFSNAVKNYGGSGSKAIFITWNKMNPIQIEKCQDSKVIRFCMKDYPNAKSREENLFKLLNREIKSINI